jgi:ribosomal protein S18 acetylase RimI-like enzyme
VIRLEPMDETDFREFVQRTIPRYAARKVERGLWKEEGALETSRADYARLLPQGRETPDHHFCNLRDAASGTRVGEVWYTAPVRGGKVQFWIEWIWVEPEHRRRGYATQALDRLEEEARRLGAERTGLNVWMDNPGAVALYSKLGYTTANMAMTKSLNRTG